MAKLIKKDKTWYHGCPGCRKPWEKCPPQEGRIMAKTMYCCEACYLDYLIRTADSVREVKPIKPMFYVSPEIAMKALTSKIGL